MQVHMALILKPGSEPRSVCFQSLDTFPFCSLYMTISLGKSSGSGVYKSQDTQNLKLLIAELFQEKALGNFIKLKSKFLKI